jgi:F0F1-type ATP synthase membrane subunit b/b'
MQAQDRQFEGACERLYIEFFEKFPDDQQKKLAEIVKDAQAKRTELFRDLRDATPEKRTEAYQKYSKLREQTDKDALAVLNDEQKKAFEQMKGKIIKLEMPQRGQRRPRTTT